MRSAIRIFSKDVRHLWPVIAVVFALHGVSIYLNREGTEPDLPLQLLDIVVTFSPVLLVVMAIHDEALCDARQFWLTRPYDWKSLLAAKALFALVFVNLTFFVADILRCVIADLPLSLQWSHLLWRQICFAGWLVLWAASVAVVTARLVQAVITCLLFVSATAAGEYWGGRHFWGGLSWLQGLAMLPVFAATAAAAVLIQYARRKTALARSVLAAGAVLAYIVGVALPLEPALALQSRLSGVDPAARNVQLAFDSDPNRPPGVFVAYTHGLVPVKIPIRLSGLPREMGVRFDLSRVRFHKGTSTGFDTGWITGLYSGWNGAGGQFPGPPGLSLGFLMNPDAWERLKDSPVEIRASVVLTLSEEDKRQAALSGAGRVVLPSGETCFVENWFPKAPFVRCQSFGRDTVAVTLEELPTRAQVTGNRMFDIRTYGPDPADFGPSPYWFGLYQFPPWMPPEHYSRPPISVRDRFPGGARLVFTVSRPVAHILREFTAAGVRLKDYRAKEM